MDVLMMSLFIYFFILKSDFLLLLWHGSIQIASFTFLATSEQIIMEFHLTDDI